VCVTETWLDDNVTSSEICIPGFDIVRLDRNRHGGGVIHYASSLFTYNIMFTDDSSFKCIITSLKLDSCNFCVCLLYRPPNASDVLDTLFSTLCSLDDRVFANFIMVGDFNMDVSNHNHPLFSKLFFVTSSFLLYQVILVSHTTTRVATIPPLIWLLYHLQFLYHNPSSLFFRSLGFYSFSCYCIHTCMFDNCLLFFLAEEKSCQFLQSAHDTSKELCMLELHNEDRKYLFMNTLSRTFYLPSVFF